VQNLPAQASLPPARADTNTSGAVKVDDPASYVASGVVLFAIALAAGLWPAIRAATTDPSTALRYDG
jgi:hypothetical protein